MAKCVEPELLGLGEHRRGAASWPGRSVTGQPATAPASRPGHCRTPVTSGWRWYGPRPTAPAAALAQVHAEHAALYAATEPVTHPHPASPPSSELAVAAVPSLDPHQVKLAEACRRGHAATRDPAFAAATETVTGLHL